MRKPGFAYAKAKAQICAADQRLCFRYTDNTSPLTFIQNFKLLAFIFDSTGQFVSDLVGNPEDGYSPITAHLIQNAM